MDLKTISSGSILTIGLFAFILSIANNNFNFALIYLITALIIWVLYGLLMNIFDIQVFTAIISASGFLVAISVLFMFGIEEVPYPVGAIIFHSGGIAGALGMGLFSFFPILILHQMRTANVQVKSKVKFAYPKKIQEPEISSEEWEMASDDDLQSGKFEVG